MLFVLAVLATWRVTHLLASEDGPADLIVRFRARLAQISAGKLDGLLQLPQLLGGCAASSSGHAEAPGSAASVAGALRRSLPPGADRLRSGDHSSSSARDRRRHKRWDVAVSRERCSRAPPTPTRTAATAAVLSQPPLTRPITPALARPAMPAAARVPLSASPQQRVNLRYLERSPILVEGPATGRQYSFSAGNPLQSVDRRDAATLLRTRFFRLD